MEKEGIYEIPRAERRLYHDQYMYTMPCSVSDLFRKGLCFRDETWASKRGTEKTMKHIELTMQHLFQV